MGTPDSTNLTSGWFDDFADGNENPTWASPSQSISIPVPPPMQGTTEPSYTSAPPPPPPPPPPSAVAPIENVTEEEPMKKVVALYQYDADTDDTIPMAEGEEF